MSRLSTHLPQLATLALAMAAAAASHWVHVERSAGSHMGPRTQLAEPTAAPGERRSGTASHGNKARHRRADRRVRGAESPGKGPRASRFREPQEPLDRPVFVTVTAQPRHERRPRQVDWLRVEPGVVRGVDPALQHLIGGQHPGGDSERRPTPSPAAPAPPAPAAPDSSATGGAPIDVGTGTTAPTTATQPNAANPDDESGSADDEDAAADDQGDGAERPRAVSPLEAGDN